MMLMNTRSICSIKRKKPNRSQKQIMLLKTSSSITSIKKIYQSIKEYRPFLQYVNKEYIVYTVIFFVVHIMSKVIKYI